ncbi:hypothetical protein G7046_g2721 [Stylonectria norvegica]|nr:hypothetical protein G7046_g2721 [Stylonectria norvegica]
MDSESAGRWADQERWDGGVACAKREVPKATQKKSELKKRSWNEWHSSNEELQRAKSKVDGECKGDQAKERRTTKVQSGERSQWGVRREWKWKWKWEWEWWVEKTGRRNTAESNCTAYSYSKWNLSYGHSRAPAEPQQSRQTWKRQPSKPTTLASSFAAVSIRMRLRLQARVRVRARKPENWMDIIQGCAASRDRVQHQQPNSNTQYSLWAHTHSLTTASSHSRPTSTRSPFEMKGANRRTNEPPKPLDPCSPQTTFGSILETPQPTRDERPESSPGQRLTNEVGSPQQLTQHQGPV